MEEESEFLAAMYRDADEAQKNNQEYRVEDADQYMNESVEEDLNIES